MTGKLIETMRSQAGELGSPALDLDSIVHEGDRRTRRRRLAAVVVGVVGAVVLGGAAVRLVDPGDPEGQVADGTTLRPHPLSYATGSRIHVGDTDLDAGRPIRAYVETDAGYVFSSTDLGVYTLIDGETARVGTLTEPVADTPELVADGSRVGWLDADDLYTVRDLATGEVVETPANHDGGRASRISASMTALDGTTAYLFDGRGPLAWDLESGAVTPVVPADGRTVVDAENGVLLVEGAPSDAVITATGSVPVQIDDFANLSPDARYVTTSYHDTGFLIDAQTGERLPFDHGHDWAMGYQWLTDHTFAAMVFDHRGDGWGKPALLTCAAATGSCQTTVRQLPAELGEFQLPIGVAFVTEG